MTVLFRTIHGSHLYGMAHAGSDVDYYTVVADNPTRRSHYSTQTIKDGQDSNVLDLSTFLHQVEIGVPQACEALMSRQAEVDVLGAFRASIVLTKSVWDRYLRTIESFAMTREDSPLHYKRKRHALRLALNLDSITRTGRFNPTLNTKDVLMISDVAHGASEHVYQAALEIAGFFW